MSDLKFCRACGFEIMQMCRKMTGLCGEICEKDTKKAPKRGSRRKSLKAKGSEDLANSRG